MRSVNVLGLKVISSSFGYRRYECEEEKNKGERVEVRSIEEISFVELMQAVGKRILYNLRYKAGRKR